MVLLIVLLILMMTTATATFAVHSTGYEIQAAGSMRQALRTRNVSEGMANALILYTKSNQLCKLVLDGNSGGMGPIDLAKYGYPLVEKGTALAQVGAVDLAQLSTSTWFESTPVPDDSLLSSSAVASTYVPNSWSVVECTEMPPPPGQPVTPNGAQAPLTFFRVEATVFGEMASTLDSSTTGDLRSDHETISISRIYLNTSE
jgi:hypothetical protein